MFQQVALHDDVTVGDAPDDTIRLTCDDPSLPTDTANLAWRAAELLRRRHGVRRGVSIHLRKRIPVGGGLAGGSADAAATLRCLDSLWQLGLTEGELLTLGAELGMDVPFCLLGGTALGTGRGEIVQPLPSLPVTPIVIAHPGVSVSTREAFASLSPSVMGGGAATEALANAVRQGDVRAVAAGLYNVFEQGQALKLPAIARIKSLMLEAGAWNAALTGSGACVFAIAGSDAEAKQIAQAVRREFPIVFVTRTVPSVRSGIPASRRPGTLPATGIACGPVFGPTL